MRINNRRYIGCKTKLLDFIEETIDKYIKDGEFSTFADIFAGTGVVANLYANKGYEVIVNDLLYSNVVVYNALLGNGVIRDEVINKSLTFFNNLSGDSLEDNYFSKIYANKYFALNDSKKIGYIRDYIEEHKSDYTDREYFYLISCLLYSCDKIANTVGHFESFLKKTPSDKKLYLEKFERI